MVGAGTGPGVQHPEDPDQPPAIMRIGRERDERWGRGAQPDVIQGLVMPPDDRPPRLGHGADPVQVGHRQEFPLALCQPGVGVEVMTRGAPAVAAGVVDIVCRATALARSALPSQRFSPAGEASRDGPALARPPVLPTPVHGLVPIAPQDVRPLWHAEAPARSAISPEGGDGGVHDVHGRGRRMGVTGGGPGALGTQPCLHDPPRPAPCQ